MALTECAQPRLVPLILLTVRFLLDASCLGGDRHPPVGQLVDNLRRQALRAVRQDERPGAPAHPRVVDAVPVGGEDELRGVPGQVPAAPALRVRGARAHKERNPAGVGLPEDQRDVGQGQQNVRVLAQHLRLQHVLTPWVEDTSLLDVQDPVRSDTSCLGRAHLEEALWPHVLGSSRPAKRPATKHAWFKDDEWTWRRGRARGRALAHGLRRELPHLAAHPLALEAHVSLRQQPRLARRAEEEGHAAQLPQLPVEPLQHLPRAAEAGVQQLRHEAIVQAAALGRGAGGQQPHPAHAREQLGQQCARGPQGARGEVQVPALADAPIRGRPGLCRALHDEGAEARGLIQREARDVITYGRLVAHHAGPRRLSAEREVVPCGRHDAV
mmetsp:Transcript_102839/g.290785  ORF Transcript_102839/g.290785 Transcript_102839/m.290785 type:complete len:384 (-) Transcript_102839:768-1919(-)